MNRKRNVGSGSLYASRLAPTPLASVSSTLSGMGTDLRRILRVAYLRMFLYTAVISFVLLAGAVTVYDFVLQPLFGVYDVVQPDGELVLFAMVASVPMVNCGRLLFVARISGRDALELFSPASLLAWRGIELVVLIALVPFLSKQLFEATGLPNVIQNLTPLVEFLFGEGSIQRVQEVAIIASVLYLYPSIVLVYLSHSKLSRLYPFTQFLSIARSWNYALLVATTIPVVLINLQILDVIDRNIVVLDMALVDP
ncbi:MAG: hypothetical protein R3324_20705, partial [Halobacteriales archaeon]|nr:hypothetical protein [Halobacteriales archaeon]